VLLRSVMVESNNFRLSAAGSGTLVHIVTIPNDTNCQCLEISTEDCIPKYLLDGHYPLMFYSHAIQTRND
jgi:hypothetical protein